MNPGDYAMLLEAFDILKKISRQLDDIASRLPMPTSKNPYGAELDKYCGQSAYKRPGTASEGQDK